LPVTSVPVTTIAPFVAVDGRRPVVPPEKVVTPDPAPLAAHEQLPAPSVMRQKVLVPAVDGSVMVQLPAVAFALTPVVPEVEPVSVIPDPLITGPVRVGPVDRTRLPDPVEVDVPVPPEVTFRMPVITMVPVLVTGLFEKFMPVEPPDTPTLVTYRAPLDAKAAIWAAVARYVRPDWTTGRYSAPDIEVSTGRFKMDSLAMA